MKWCSLQRCGHVAAYAELRRESMQIRSLALVRQRMAWAQQVRTWAWRGTTQSRSEASRSGHRRRVVPWFRTGRGSSREALPPRSQHDDTTDTTHVRLMHRLLRKASGGTALSGDRPCCLVKLSCLERGDYNVTVAAWHVSMGRGEGSKS